MTGYDPSKPFNEETMRIAETTWPAAAKWGVIVQRVGKRATVKHDRADWESADTLKTTDGTGTKGYLHWLMRTFDSAAQDAFAMNVDDQIELGYVTCEIVDGIKIQEEDKDAIWALVGGAAKLCKEHEIILTNGETAILDTLKGLEMDMTAIGVRKFYPKQQIIEGNKIIGLESSGIHSNGLTFARELYFDKLGMKLDDKMEWGRTIGEELTIPTKVYQKGLIRLLENYQLCVNSGVHITGGGLKKHKEMDPAKKYVIELDMSDVKIHPIFKDMFEKSQGTDEPLTPKVMCNRLNCGIGYSIAIDGNYADDALKLLAGYNPKIIGYARLRNIGEKPGVIVNNHGFGDGAPIVYD